MLLFARRHQCEFVVLDIWEDLKEKLISDVKKLGSVIHFYKVDLSKFEETNDVLSKVKSNHWCPDVVINNAAMVTGHSILSNNY